MKNADRLNLQGRRERNRNRIRKSKLAKAKKKFVSAIAICIARGFISEQDQVLVKVAIPRYNDIKPKGDLRSLLDALVKHNALAAREDLHFPEHGRIHRDLRQDQ